MNKIIQNILYVIAIIAALAIVNFLDKGE